MSNDTFFSRILLLKHHRQPHQSVLSEAVELARRSRGRLTFAHTLEGGEQISEMAQRERLRELEAALAPHLQDYPADYRLMSGDLTEAVESSAHQFDLVIPSEGVTRSEAAWRETMRLLRRSPIPIWLGGRLAPPRSILAALDVQTGNPLKLALNLPILRRAIRLASLFDAPLSLLSVLTPATAADSLARRLAGEAPAPTLSPRVMRELLRNLLEAALGDGPAPTHEPRLLVAQGEPERLIRQAAESASVDLLVAGSLGRSGLAAWLIGNTSERLSSHLAYSLLVVKPTSEQVEELSGRGRSRAA